MCYISKISEQAFGRADLNLEYWIKRDDSTSFDLSGNKVRKLEFLLADAVRGKHDCVITIGIEKCLLTSSFKINLQF